jgi:hypothetical protein
MIQKKKSPPYYWRRQRQAVAVIQLIVIAMKTYVRDSLNLGGSLDEVCVDV